MPSELQVRTPLLDIAYELSGPPKGRPIILLHGWPDGVRTWDRILAPMHQAGWRTYVPWLRGYGNTRFIEGKTFRCGQVAALAQDVLDFAQGVGLDRFAIMGHDWGARAAYTASCLAGERITVCVAISIGWEPVGKSVALDMQQIQNYWYHWYMALDRGEALLRQHPKAFTRHIWEIWNPGYAFTDEEFEETAKDFGNPDWPDVVLHYYRMRWGLADPDPAYTEIEARVQANPVISVPTLVLHGGADPCTQPSTSEGKERFFSGPYERYVIEDAGHFVQRQRPDAVVQHVLAFLQQH